MKLPPKREKPDNKAPKAGIFDASVLSGEEFILERPRLDAIFKKAAENSVVFVKAGEGHGKTCAVHSFLRKKNKKTIWIEFSERDNDPLHFWETVIQAVSIHEKGIGKVMEEIGFPESAGQITRCISIISGGEKWLFAPTDNSGSVNRGVHGKRKYTIVADNCHYVNDEAILLFVNRLFLSPFQKNTTILISRRELNLNTMAFLSKGLLARINQDDLRFNEEEILLLFRQRNISLSREESKKILEDTEGWILPISFILEEMRSGAKKYSRSFLKTGSFRKMQEDLFHSVPVSLQRFLIVISLFNMWPLEVLEKTGSSLPHKLPEAGELAVSINRLSSFYSYNAYLRGFRFHRIFLEFLREKQKEVSGEEIKTACTINARWCLKNHLRLDAAISYEMAGDYRELLKTIYSFPRLISRPAAASFLKIMDRIPEKAKYGEEDRNLQFLHHVSRPWMLLNLGRYAESRAAFLKTIGEFKALPPDEFNSCVLSSCYNSLGSLSVVSYRETRDLGRILEYFEHGNYYYMQHPFAVPGPVTKVSIGSYASPIRYPPLPGEFEKFIEITAQCIPYASSSMGGFLSGMDSLCRAELAFFSGDLNSTEQYAREAVYKAREKKQYETESKGLFYILRLQICNGDAGAVQETLRHMKALLDIPDFINRYVIHEIMTGWYYAHTGETDRIVPWLKSESGESDLNLLYHNFETMVKAKIFFAEKKYEKALDFLKQREVKDGIGSFYLGKLEITALEAAVRNRLGDAEGAIKALKAAQKMSLYDPETNNASLELSHDGPQGNVPPVFPAGLEMPFIELGEDMRILAGMVLDNNRRKCGINRQWLSAIRNKASVYGKKLTTIVEYNRRKYGEGEIPHLSSQEISVLRDISKGLTGKDAAYNSSLSQSTVKIIIKNIYTKLGAFNRADAIQIAAKLGIL